MKNEKNQAFFDNRRRHQEQPLHESWFVKANSLNSAKALWLKMTLCDRGMGSVAASAWCSVFDGDNNLAWASREQLPLWQSRFEDGALELEGCRMLLDPEKGAARGHLRDSRGEARWDIAWQRIEGPLGDALSLPNRRLVDSPLLKSQLLTPAPALIFSGFVEFNGERWQIDNWQGMQGHNWSQAAPVQYVWGTSQFVDEQGQIVGLVEALAGRIRVAGLRSPDLALMLIRHRDKIYHFDNIAALWRRKTKVTFPEWSMSMRSKKAKATLHMRADPKRMVCLGYEYPGKPDLAYCLNSKLAEVELRVEPTDAEPFMLHSAHGGALEFLQQERPDGLLTVL